jgi:hypothetical protein
MPNTPTPAEPRPENKTLLIESQLLFVANETVLSVTQLTETMAVFKNMFRLIRV